MAGQAPVDRDRLLDHAVGGDAVAAGLLGEALVVGRDGSERLARRVQQRGSRLLDDVGLVDLERPNSLQHSRFQVTQQLDVDVRVEAAQRRDPPEVVPGEQ